MAIGACPLKEDILKTTRESVIPGRINESFDTFGFSPEFGFISPNPLQSLPTYFEIWENLAKNCELLIGKEALRLEVDKMPLLNHELLQSYDELRFAHTCLSALVHGYVWMAGEHGIVSAVPKNLSIPLCGISEKLGIDPVLRHYTFVLNNWRLVDISGKLELSNVETIIKLHGGDDESWFFMVALQMELEAAPGIWAVLKAQKAINEDDVELVTKSLNEIALSIYQVECALRRIHERCRPHLFYNEIRPYFNGWDGDAFKSKGLRGLVYEGVSPEPKSYAGGSGAQSAILYVFDSALAVRQTSSVYNAFYNMLCPAHKEFIKKIKSGNSIKAYVLKQNCKQIKGSFDNAVRALQALRSYHLQVVARYIVIQSNRHDTDKRFETHGNAGTGGTDYMTFLKNLRDTTRKTTLEYEKEAKEGLKKKLAI